MAGLTSAVTLLGSLGGQLGSVATVLGSVATAADTIGTIRGYGAQENAQEQALRQMQEQQRLQQEQAEANANLAREKIAAEADADEQRRSRALKNAVARQRAQFGSSGISAGSSGSAQAVLLGAYNESEEDASNRSRLDQLRVSGLKQETSQLAQRNLLQQTQLSEKQRLNNVMNGG